MQGGSLKLVVLVTFIVFTICLTSLKIEAKSRRQLLHQRHSRHPEQCAPTMPLPSVEEPAEPPSEPPSLPPSMEGASVPSLDEGVPVIVLDPGYQLTPFRVRACYTPCKGPKDCYWPCMAACPNSTCCDQ